MTTAADLARSGACTGACLTAATPEEHCRCKGCSGRLHGLAAGADLTGLLDGRARGLDRMTDVEVLSSSATLLDRPNPRTIPAMEGTP